MSQNPIYVNNITDFQQDDGSHSVACDKCNVWQHSACLGIAQADAEKDDFHFVCHDCKRREEDAKRPKIPSLKFHIGSSSSPPQKPKVAVPAANGTKKRKADEKHSHLPPTKNFRPVDGNQQNQVPSRPLQNGDSSDNGTHTVLMNGPTLSPQGQVPRSLCAGNEDKISLSRRTMLESNQPSAGLGAPAGPPSIVNGYPQQIKHTNGNACNNSSYTPQLPPQSSNSPFSGNQHYSGRQQQNVGWSARYTSPQRGQSQQIYGPAPSPPNPFTNSFDRRRPSSSHSVHNVPSPMKNAPSLSTPQQYSSVYNVPPYQTPHSDHSLYVNGISSHQSLPPTGQPVYSPIKQRSPPTMELPAKQSPFSSPITHQPPLQSTAQTSPGYSPTKHSPPHQKHSSRDVPSTPAVLPPAPSLSPSPVHQTFVPEQIMTTNGHATEQRNA